MTKTIVNIFIASILSLFVLSGNVLAGKTLVDNFSSGYLDGTKWFPREYVHHIENGKFVAKLGNSSGMGAEVAPGVFHVYLSFVDPADINTIQADITLQEVRLDQQGTDTESYAMIGGRFYNVNDVVGGVGDIWAELGIGDRGNGLEAFWVVVKFVVDDYSQWVVIERGTLDLGHILQLDETVTAKISYDGNKTIEFSAGGQSATFVGLEDKTRGAYNAYKALTVDIEATDGSNTGYIAATFDDIYINNSNEIYDDFSSTTIDLTKWDRSEWVREVANGRLQNIYKRANSTGQVNTILFQEDASYFEARVRIDSATQLSDGASCIARLQGYYYNDSRGPGSGNDYNGYERDVFGQIRLQYLSDGSLNAQAFVGRSDSSDESVWTDLFGHTFAVPISLDTEYTLSIAFKNNKLTFKCNDETVAYDITTPMYVPYGQHRLLRSRLYLDQGESGYLKTQFDNVYIEGVDAMPAINYLLLK